MRRVTQLFLSSDVWLIVAFVVGLAIRLHRLDERSIWFDEASSWRTSQFPLPEMFDRVAANCHPPLYYLCLKGWTSLFGDSLWALRGLSVAFSGALIVATYVFVRALYDVDEGADSRGKWAAVVAAMLIAVSPFQIRMAWEARMYMLGAALAVISSWSLLIAWRRRHSLPLWIAYGATVLLFAYTHYYALFTIFAQFLFLTTSLLLQHRSSLRMLVSDSRTRGALVSLVVVAVGWLPWLPTFVAQRQQIEEQWWTGQFRWVSLIGVSETMVVGKGGSGWIAVVSACAVIAVSAVLLVRRSPSARYLALLIVCPIVLSTVYSLGYRNIIVDRYFVFAQVFILCGIAVLLARISDCVVRNAAALLLVTWSVAAYYDMWTNLDIANRHGARGAAEFISANAERGEPVIVSSSLIYYPMLYHLGDQVDCHLLKSEVLAHNVGGPFAQPEDFIAVDAMARISTERIWVVKGGWEDRPVPIPAHWVLVTSQSFREVFGFQGQVTVEQFKIDENHIGKRGE